VPARYVPDHKDFGKFMLSDQVRDVANEAADNIVKIAAVMAAKGKTGNYARGFRRVSGRALVVGGNPRAIADVVNDDPAALPNEIGTSRMSARHTLAKAGAIVGELRGARIED
jgi:ATP/maltotriose-dependent transcriptional regulator MalT